MSKLELIEDCSPYFIRFHDPNIDKIFAICDNEMENKTWNEDFTHSKFSTINSVKISETCVLFKLFEINLDRISMFVSKPGLYFRAHKDGIDHHFSLNYTYKILDDRCLTSWYSDKELARYPLLKISGIKQSRECLRFDPKNHTPLKTMIAKPNELILFNTEIFHAWDNSRSENIRMILTLRLKDYSKENTMFEDAKKVLMSNL